LPERRPLKPDAGNAAVGSEEFEISAMRFPRMAFFSALQQDQMNQESRKTGKETFQRLQPAGPGYQMKKRINLFNLPAFLLS
jgi:hypothetical protein